MKRVLLLITMLFVLVFGAFAQSYQSMNNDDIAKILSKKKVQVVDVRTSQEYNSGHLPHAINIDVNQPDFETRIMVLNKKRPVVVYCRSGRRSKKAAQVMAAKGYQVYEMDKGYVNWPGEKVMP
jgi:rhodanese-related sulfurtransferase